MDLPSDEFHDFLKATNASLRSVKVLGMNRNGSEAELIDLVGSGLSGLVSSRDGVAQLRHAIHGVILGEFPCSPRFAAALVRRLNQPSAPSCEPSDAHLTAREVEIAGLIGQGLCNKEIAWELSIEVGTVKNHVHHILTKLGISSRGQIGMHAQGTNRRLRLVSRRKGSAG